jgi:hypothetical protein
MWENYIPLIEDQSAGQDDIHQLYCISATDEGSGVKDEELLYVMTEQGKTVSLTTGSYCYWFYDNDDNMTMGIYLTGTNKMIKDKVRGRPNYSMECIIR